MNKRIVHHLLLLLVSLLLTSACGMGRGPRRVPPTPTPVPTATPMPTPVPTPVSTVASTSDDVTAAAANPTPQVVIPDNFTVVKDERLGYSLAVSRGWSALDLRSTQIQTLAGFLGMSEQLAPLNAFLDSAEGQVVGKIYIADISAAMFGGLPALLNVTVFDAPGLTAEAAAEFVQAQIDANLSKLGDGATVSAVEAKVINNLPALEADATIDLASIGINNQAYARVVALLANDQIYLLTFFVPAGQRENKAAELDQIVGTFRPE